MALALACCAVALGIFFLGWILWSLGQQGWKALRWSLLTQNTPPPGSQGGLSNALFGSLLMTSLATLVGTPIGILAGTYLAEVGKESLLARATRFINSVLLSAPSILIGFFVYVVLVMRMGHFSGYAGAIALSLLVIPIVVTSTENMLRLVPNTLREAAAALGAPRWKVTLFISMRAARAGMLTGVLLAVARISGETAPLLFTALNNQFWNSDMSKAMANVPVVIFQFAMSPYWDWQVLAWGGALMITLSVLILNLIARLWIHRLPESE